MMTVRRRMSSPAFFGSGGMIDPANNDPTSSGLRIDRSLSAPVACVWRLSSSSSINTLCRPWNGDFSRRG
jgi:hypothetical protein